MCDETISRNADTKFGDLAPKIDPMHLKWVIEIPLRQYPALNGDRAREVRCLKEIDGSRWTTEDVIGIPAAQINVVSHRPTLIKEMRHGLAGLLLALCPTPPLRDQLGRLVLHRDRHREQATGEQPHDERQPVQTPYQEYDPI